MRARNWKEKAGYTYGLHGTPTTFTLEERIATLEGGLQTLLVPSGLASITLVDMALARGRRRGADPGQRLRPEQGVRAPRARCAGASRHALLRPDGCRRRSRAAITPATRLVWLEAPGSVTMEFPDLAALVAVARERGVVGGARQHLGRRPGLRPVRARAGRRRCAAGRRHLGPGAHQVPLGRRRRADGLGDDARRGAAPAPQGDPHAHRLRRRRQRRRARAALAAVAAAALRGAGARRAGARAVVARARPRSRRCCIRRCRTRPGHEHWARLCSDAAGLFSVVFDARYAHSAGRRLRRCAGACSHRLLLGRADQPGRALRPGAAARRAAPAAARWCASRSASRTVDDLIADCLQALAALDRR